MKHITKMNVTKLLWHFLYRRLLGNLKWRIWFVLYFYWTEMLYKKGIFSPGEAGNHSSFTKNSLSTHSLSTWRIKANCAYEYWETYTFNRTVPAHPGVMLSGNYKLLQISGFRNRAKGWLYWRPKHTRSGYIGRGRKGLSFLTEEDESLGD